MVKFKIPQIAGQKVLKQYCHKSVLRIKQKLKKMDLTSLVSTEIKLTKVLYFLKGSIRKKRLHLKNVSYLIMSSLRLSTYITIQGIFSCLLYMFPKLLAWKRSR